MIEESFETIWFLWVLNFCCAVCAVAFTDENENNVKIPTIKNITLLINLSLHFNRTIIPLLLYLKADSPAFKQFVLYEWRKSTNFFTYKTNKLIYLTFESLYLVKKYTSTRQKKHIAAKDYA